MQRPMCPGTEEDESCYGASVNDVRRVRTERSVIAFLAFIGILMAFGIDAVLPAFDQLSNAFDLDERGISPAVTGTVYFAMPAK